MSEAIAQEAARKDVKDIADSYGGETSASGDSRGVNEVTRVNRKSRGRFLKRGKGHARDGKSGQPAGDKKRCFRCGLTNHTQDNCRYKGAECFKCAKQAICSLNVLARSAPLSRRKIDNMSVLQKIPSNYEQATQKMVFKRVLSL